MQFLAGFGADSPGVDDRGGLPWLQCGKSSQWIAACPPGFVGGVAKAGCFPLGMSVPACVPPSAATKTIKPGTPASGACSCSCGSPVKQYLIGAAIGGLIVALLKG